MQDAVDQQRAIQDAALCSLKQPKKINSSQTVYAIYSPKKVFIKSATNYLLDKKNKSRTTSWNTCNTSWLTNSN